MKYSIEPLQDDCYENTAVLKNKFGIKDEANLELMERNITGFQIMKAYKDIVFENVDFAFYKKLHYYVFSDIYEWAGCVRGINMSKKGTMFCPFEKIEEFGKSIFQRLDDKCFFRSLDFEEFVNDFTDLYCSLNYLHPFREGNGRIQRLFLSMMLKNAGMYIDFSGIDKDDIMIATIKSSNGDVFMLKNLFKNHIKIMK